MVTSASLTIDTKGGKRENRKRTFVIVAFIRSIPCIDFHSKHEVH